MNTHHPLNSNSRKLPPFYQSLSSLVGETSPFHKNTQASISCCSVDGEGLWGVCVSGCISTYLAHEIEKKVHTQSVADPGFLFEGAHDDKSKRSIFFFFPKTIP